MPVGVLRWSDLYTDVNGLRTITCSMTFQDDTGETVGVVAMDIEIDTLFGDISFLTDTNSQLTDDVLLDTDFSFISRDEAVPEDLLSIVLEDGRTLLQTLKQSRGLDETLFIALPDNGVTCIFTFIA